MRAVCNACHNRAGFGVIGPHVVCSIKFFSLAVIFQSPHFPKLYVRHYLAILRENPMQRVHGVDMLKPASVLLRMSRCFLLQACSSIVYSCLF